MPRQLLRELETLTHNGRLRRMVELGRQARTEQRMAATLAALARGDVYQRLLALHACQGSRDGAHVVRALTDPSHLIRTRAAGLVADVCDDAQALAALAAAPAAEQILVLRRLAKRRRQGPVDAFLDARVERGDERLGMLLPYGSAAAVERHLADGFALASAADWTRLARRHPAIAAERLTGRAEAATRLDARLVWQARPAVPLLARRDPDAALALVHALVRHAPLSSFDLTHLMRRRPAAVVDLLLAAEVRAPHTLAAVLPHLDTDRLLTVIEHQMRVEEARPSYGAWFARIPDRTMRRQILRKYLVARTAAEHSLASMRRTWFPRLSPTQRAAVFQAGGHGWRDAEGCLDTSLLALLPGDLREQEARRNLALPALATRPADRLAYAAFLPWTEARAIIDPFLDDSEPDLRAAALTALLSAVRFARDHLPEVLALLHAHRHEPDPVRGRVLHQLNHLPPGLWRPEHLPALDQVIHDAFNAADLSRDNVPSAVYLSYGLLPLHPIWAATWLVWLAEHTLPFGNYSISGHAQRFTSADTRRLIPALLPVLRAWEEQGRAEEIVALANTLGSSLRRFDALADILVRLLLRRGEWSVVYGVLRLITKYRPERLHTLVPELLRQDPAWITHEEISSYLHHARQDLLTPFLRVRRYHGRISRKHGPFVLPIGSGFYRWTARQQMLFASTLDELTRAEDDGRQHERGGRLDAVRRLAALPAAAPTRLIELAGDERQPVRETALWALGRLDAGQGLSTLVAMLADERARVAIYALRLPLRALPAAQALALLRAVPRTKITVAKEVIRLLGELPLPEAYQELLARYGQERHISLRIALLRALWNHLERPETWGILEEAAGASEAAVAASLAQIPPDRLSATAQARLVGLLARLLDHPEPRTRLAVLERCVNLPVTDADRVLLPVLLARLAAAAPAERAAAAKAVLATYPVAEAGLVGQTVATLLPNRRALAGFLAVLREQLDAERPRTVPTARAVLAALAIDPLTAGARVELAVRVLPWTELAALLIELVTDGQLHAGVLATAVTAIERAADRPDSGNLGQVEAALATSPDERLRRLALAALVALAAPPRGWDNERRARLQIFRADPAPLVAAAAQFTLPPDE